MKVYYVVNDKGYYYGSTCRFTKNGPPKLYGSESVLRRSLASAKKWGGDGYTLPSDMYIAEGELKHIVTHME